MGPKSSSESLLLGATCVGGEEGFSERGAGGGAGPIVRCRLAQLELLEMGEELRAWDCESGDGSWASSASCCRFRLARRWGGSSGPAVAIIASIVVLAVRLGVVKILL